MKGAATFWTSLVLLAIIQCAMCETPANPQDVKSFFADVKGNLTKIVWAHAVNDKAALDKALGDAKVMMLEADVVLGTAGNDTTKKVPIMAHPPATTSNLTLDDFMTTVIGKNTTKGVKLDFKSLDAFVASKPVLEKHSNDTNFPVFLNADILAGPVNATSTAPVDAKAFLDGAKTSECTLSLGWTTRYGADEKVDTGAYTKEQVKSMLDTVQSQTLTQPITFAVRAGLVANDIDVIKTLVQNTTTKAGNATLSIWSHDKDAVNATKLSTLIRDVGVENVYLDVPEDLMKQLQLSSSATPIASLVLTTMLAMIIRRV